MSIKNYVPGYMYVAYEPLYEMWGIDLDNIEYWEQDIKNNIHVKTATWGLDDMEKIYGIDYIPNDDYEVRRSRILAKKRSGQECTIPAIQAISDAYIGEAVSVDDQHYEEDYFVIKFEKKMKRPKKIEDFYRSICEIKPAHLNARILFSQIVWQDVLDKGTWKQATANEENPDSFNDWDSVLNFL